MENVLGILMAVLDIINEMSFCASKSVRVSPMVRSDSHRWGGESLTGFEV